jgi:hypothetical protein
MRGRRYILGVNPIEGVHIGQDVSQLLGIKLYGLFIKIQSGQFCYMDDLFLADLHNKYLLVLSELKLKKCVTVHEYSFSSLRGAKRRSNP